MGGSEGVLLGSREPPELPLDPPLKIAMHAPAPFTRLQSGFQASGDSFEFGSGQFFKYSGTGVSD